MTVEGHDELQPTLELKDANAEDGFFGPAGPEAQGFAVDNIAGATLGVPEGAEAVDFEVTLTDQRNRIEEELSPYYGGDAFGYTIGVETSDVEIQEVDSGTVQTVALDSPGDLALFEMTVDEGHLLYLGGGTDDDGIDEDVDVTDLPYIPSWGFLDSWTLETVMPFDGMHLGDGDTRQFLLRDNFFRGGDSGFESEVRFITVDTTLPDYGSAELHGDNADVSEALNVDLPVTIGGQFEYSDDQQQQEEPSPEIRYFTVETEPDDVLIAFTENGPNMESIISIVDEDGDEIEGSSYLMEQREAGEQESYFDRAMFYDATDGGEHIVAVEQYCGQSFQGAYCEEGDVEVNLFTGK